MKRLLARSILCVAFLAIANPGLPVFAQEPPKKDQEKKTAEEEKKQKLTEQEYMKVFSAADDQYSRILTALLSQLKKTRLRHTQNQNATSSNLDKRTQFTTSE